MSPAPLEVTLTKSQTGTGGYFLTSANPAPTKLCQEQPGAQLAPASTEPFPGLGPTELLQAARGLPRLIQICLVVYKHPIKHLGTRDRSLPDDALEFLNWDLFLDLLSVRKKKNKKNS